MMPALQMAESHGNVAMSHYRNRLLDIATFMHAIPFSCCRVVRRIDRRRADRRLVCQTCVALSCRQAFPCSAFGFGLLFGLP